MTADLSSVMRELIVTSRVRLVLTQHELYRACIITRRKQFGLLESMGTNTPFPLVYMQIIGVSTGCPERGGSDKSQAMASRTLRWTTLTTSAAALTSVFLVATKTG